MINDNGITSNKKKIVNANKIEMHKATFSPLCEGK